MTERREVDLLVVGAGPAGMTAALVASLEGLDVLLCEKSDQVGGTGATSAGTLWIPGNTQNKAAGFDDSADRADAYLDALIGEGTNRALRDAYLKTGPAAIDYLVERSDVKFLPCGTHPDYRSNMPGAAISGRAIVPAPFDGRLLGSDFKRVRAPIREFLVFGGMMVGKPDIAPLIGRFKSVKNFAYAARLLTRYLTDRLRYPRGTRLMMGNALVARLFYSLRKQDVPIRFGASLKELTGDRSRVTGARLATGDGELIVTARRGVVLATGGYAHNERFRERYMPKASPIYSLSLAANQGEGVAAAERLGVALTGNDVPSGLWSPVSLTKRRDGTTGLYPHLVFDRAKPGLIAVNAAGRRFVNEACSYHDFVLAMFDGNDAAKTIPAWLICDAPFLKKYGLGAVYPGHADPDRFIDEGYLVRAATLDELAAKTGVDPAGLKDSVARNNRYAVTGVDVDFAKGETELNRFNGDAAHKPNPCIGPLATPPFYALAVWPADLAVSSGITTDADARALTPDGSVIAGLYACGNDMESVMGGSYPGPGTTLGPAMVFAYRAAMRAKSGPP